MKINEIWEKVSNIIKKNDSKPIHNRKYLKAEKKLTQKQALI